MDLPPNRRVLIVDDDAGIRLLLVTVLRRRGFRLLEARNGREALAIMRAGSADLIVLDLMMPEISGWEVLRERAGDPLLRRIPIIVVTATNIPEARSAVVHDGVCAVLAKPFDLDTLLATVTTCLGHPHVPEVAAA